MRKLQHISFHNVIQEAKHEGQKLTALCGERIYPMTEMKAEIPTCTPCAKELMRRNNQPASWTYTAGPMYIFRGGAA